MRFGRKHRQPPSGLSFNATPLIDVIFTLTMFYMLIAKFSSAEQVPMQLPKPADSRAQIPNMPDRVVVNCRLAGASDGADRIVLYSIGPNNPESLGAIAERLALMKQQAPGLKVVIRADRRLAYEDVRVVMRLIAENGIELLNVVAHISEGR
jgi:biopolymer transport protein TolR